MKLNEFYDSWMSDGGVFADLSVHDPPWESDKTYSLGIQYHGNHSGGKTVSPLLESLIEDETARGKIATVICALYLPNWGKLWNTMELEYNPIENYSMTEEMSDDITTDQYGKSTTRTDNLTHRKTGTETADIDETDTRTDNLTHRKTGTETADIDETDTRTDNLTHVKTGTETRTDNLTDTTTPNLTTNTNNNVYGFNSSNAVPSDTQAQISTGTNTETHTGTEQRQYNLSDTDTGTQTTVKDGSNETTYNTTDTDTGTQTAVKDGTNETTYNTTDTDTGTQTTLDGGADTHTRNYTLTRAGNIGVTTSQQMIESERALWIWNFFETVVFPDIDRVLTLQIY